MKRDIAELRNHLARGQVIPACPLALDMSRSFDERHQRALVRYYAAAGAGGLAVGVHTTQFAIHQAQLGLYKPVLELAGDEMVHNHPDMVRVAGIVGRTSQAVREAELARSLGYDAGLLSLAAYGGESDEAMLAHCRAVAEVLPLFGFYLQPAAGGRFLSYRFWRSFCEIDPVVAIKIAPFNRYQTLDVIRAVYDAGRCGDIALYTGNDDHIIGDLLTTYRFNDRLGVSVQIVGGLLGHWAVWTSAAARHLAACRAARERGVIPAHLLTLGSQVTEANAALFDAANGYAGCISGIQYVLARQGLLACDLTLDPHERLSPGQAEEIERVRTAYPHLCDDRFVSEHIGEWLS
ncbi:MAG: dihydrodipicolinate synthase family protein [Chloroflexi bacterium]|nr:dihydrodipicolinate synthase family protein [Chloroflexota bacterium]